MSLDFIKFVHIASVLCRESIICVPCDADNPMGKVPRQAWRRQPEFSKICPRTLTLFSIQAATPLQFQEASMFIINREIQHSIGKLEQ
jgi:hypothetical protein